MNRLSLCNYKISMFSFIDYQIYKVDGATESIRLGHVLYAVKSIRQWSKFQCFAISLLTGIWTLYKSSIKACHKCTRKSHPQLSSYSCEKLFVKTLCFVRCNFIFTLNVHIVHMICHLLVLIYNPLQLDC